MKILYILPLVWMLVFTSCNSDFLDREPSNKYTDDILLTSTEGGMMLLNGTLRRTYISYESHAQYGQKAVDIMTDMLGEDYTREMVTGTIMNRGIPGWHTEVRMMKIINLYGCTITVRSTI